MEITEEIPGIQFPSEWIVKIIPPFNGAGIKFIVKKAEESTAYISVYLDCYDLIDVTGEPYWGVCPTSGNVERCYMNETEKLLEIIQRGLDDL